MMKKFFPTILLAFILPFLISCMGNTERTEVTQNPTFSESSDGPEETYSLTFSDFEGSVLARTDHEFGADLSTVSSSFSLHRPGYVFLGWNQTIPTTMPDHDVILQAQYAFYLDYEIENDHVVITGLLDGVSIPEVEVPEWIDGKPVTAIGSNAFSGADDMTSIVVPNSVEFIGYGAFWGTSRLSSLTLPFVGASRDGTGEEGHFGHVFGQTPYAGSYEANGYWLPDTLNEVVLSDTEEIGDHAFEGAQKITSITLPTGVLKIGKYAFKGAKRLAPVVLPASLTTIEAFAFADCEGMWTITIPSGVSTIDEEAFLGCFFSSIAVDEVNPYFSSQDGILFDKNKTVLLTFPPAKVQMDYWVPDGVTRINRFAFYVCSSVYNLTIPASVTEIGENAFYNCFCLQSITVDESNLFFSSQDGVLFDESKTTIITFPIRKLVDKYTIPSSVTQIEDFAFWGGTYLKELVLPPNLISIGNEAFNHVFQVTALSFPDSLSSIGDRAFYDCFGLKSITLSANVSHIGQNAFTNCQDLEVITVDELNAAYCSQDGVLYDKMKTILMAYPAQKTETEFSVPSGVTVIDDSAFRGSRNLWRVSIPASVGSIGKDAFLNCSGLSSITVDEGNLSYTSRNGVLFDKGTTILIACPLMKTGSFSIPEGVTSIGDSAFYRSQIDQVSIPSSVVTIGDSAFIFSELSGVSFRPGSQLTTINNRAFQYTRMTSITIPSGVTTLGDYAFGNCTQLTTVLFETGSQLTGIGEYAFQFCFALTEIDILTHVSRIGNHAFDGCESLTSISVDEGNSFYSSHEGVLFDKSKTVLIVYPQNKPESHFSIPSGVTIIDRGVFSNSRTLRDIWIPATVTNIDDNAFSDCITLKSVTFESGSQLTRIGSDAFRNCQYLSDLPIPEGVTSIGNFAFYDCRRLTDISIPASVTSIGNGVFFYCNSLSSITVDERNPSLSSQDGILYDKEKSTLLLYPAGKPETSFSIPDGVITIGAYSFYSCKNLQSILIPTTVVAIGDSSFGECNGFSSFSIPANVTQIERWAFSNCGNLTTMTFEPGSQLTGIGDYAFCNSAKLHNLAIPEGVTTLGEGAFYGCSDLIDVSLPESLTTIRQGAFLECGKLASLTIPAGVTVIGERAFAGCPALTIQSPLPGQPSGWDPNWNPDNRPVIWGFQE